MTQATKVCDLEKALAQLIDRKNSGFPLPEVLQNLVSTVEQIAKCAVMAVGVMIKYTGLFLVLGGAAHFLIVLSQTPFSTLTIPTLQIVIKNLISSGAMPTLISGVTMMKCGEALMGQESISWLLSTVLWCFPPPWNNWVNTTYENDPSIIFDL